MKLQEINDSDENTAMGLDSDYQENYQKVLKQSFGDITLKEVKLTDFNISRKIDTDTSEKSTLTNDCGTRYYKSPEMSNSKYDYKTDVWYFE